MRTGSFAVVNERGDVGKELEPVGELAAFEVRFAVKNFPAMHLGLLREDARAEKVLLDLRERGLVSLQVLFAQDESADEKERAFLFVELRFIEIEEVHGDQVERSGLSLSIKHPKRVFKIPI